MPRGQGQQQGRGQGQQQGRGMQRLAIAERARDIIKRKSNREELLDKCGKTAFLDAENLRFPIVNPISGNCTPDCKLLHAAYVRAKQFHYDNIASKAETMYKANGCEEKLKIKIHSEEQ